MCVCVCVCRRGEKERKSKPLGLSDTSPCSTLAVSFRAGEKLFGIGQENGVNLLSALSHLILFQCSLTHHCLIYKRPFNIHACLGDISQTLWRQLEIYWLLCAFPLCVYLQSNGKKRQTCFISFWYCCLLHLYYLTFWLSVLVSLHLFLSFRLFLFFSVSWSFPVAAPSRK